MKAEYSRAWDEIRHMQQRGERPDEKQFQALAALDAERKALEKRDRRGRGDWATASPPRSGQRLLKKEVDSEEIAEVVSQWTGIPVARMLTTEREKLLKLEDQIHLRMVEPGRGRPRRGRRRPPQPGRACRTRTGRSARSCSWARPASARPSWPRPWPSSSSTARRPWSAST